MITLITFDYLLIYSLKGGFIKNTNGMIIGM